MNFDFIVLSEVAEHLFSPGVEFERLCGRLTPGGHLGVMTLLFDETIDFESWYYRRDPTHVTFYSRHTFRWLERQLDLAELTFIGDRIILLRRPEV